MLSPLKVGNGYHFYSFWYDPATHTFFRTGSSPIGLAQDVVTACKTQIINMFFIIILIGGKAWWQLASHIQNEWVRCHHPALATCECSISPWPASETHPCKAPRFIPPFSQSLSLVSELTRNYFLHFSCSFIHSPVVASILVFPELRDWCPTFLRVLTSPLHSALSHGLLVIKKLRTYFLRSIAFCHPLLRTQKEV